VKSRSSALRLMRWGLVLALIGLGGCATLHEAVGSGKRLDPWENWNRKVFSFNESLDEVLLTPVATLYNKVVPQLVRQGLDNFFANPFDAWSALNNFMQGKGDAGMQDVMRFGTNTMLGLGGLLDIASEMGIERHHEDLGKTLAHWGVGAGAYVVWPLLGPSTVRESFALPLDRAVSPALMFDSNVEKTALLTLQLINLRAGLLGASRVLDDIALDKYTFVRDAYLQRRHSLTFDGDEWEEPDVDTSEPLPAPTPAPRLYIDVN